MRKITILSLVMLVSVILFVSSINATYTEEKLEKYTYALPIEWTVDNFNVNENYMSDKIEVVSEEVEEELERPYIEGIELEDKILDYIWEVSIEKNLSYELILAFCKVESNFTSHIRSKTSDSGMMQINDGTEEWIAEQLGLNDYNLMDAKTSIDFGVFYITYLRNQYRAKGLSEEDVFYYTVTAYNRGIKGANKYIQKHGMNVKYTEKIIYYKELYEQGGITG